MKKITAIFALILFFLIFLFLIFNKKDEVKKEVEDLNFQSNSEDISKKENVLGLFDKQLETPKESYKTQETSNKQSTNNNLTNKDEEESNNENKEKEDEDEDGEEIPNPTPTPTPTPVPTTEVTPTPTPTPNPEPTVETEKEETLEEKTDFISKSLADETFAEKETIDATFLPDLVNLFGTEELSKVFVGVEKIEFSNFEQNGNEGKADALVKTASGEKSYKCYFYKISNKWYLYKTE